MRGTKDWWSQFRWKAQVLRLCGYPATGFTKKLGFPYELLVLLGPSILKTQVDEITYVLVMS
jgi:hypothetical protein